MKIFIPNANDNMLMCTTGYINIFANVTLKAVLGVEA